MNSMRMLPTRACDIFGHRFHFRPSILIRYECVFVLILFQERFQMDAFLMKTLSVLVWPKGMEMCAFSNANAIVWTGPYSDYKKQKWPHHQA